MSGALGCKRRLAGSAPRRSPATATPPMRVLVGSDVIKVVRKGCGQKEQQDRQCDERPRPPAPGARTRLSTRAAPHPRSRGERTDTLGRSPRKWAPEKAEIVGLLDQLWKAIGEVEFSDLSRSAADVEGTAQAIAPVVWLLGKTGAGKTAIVAALTGDPRAAIGVGFEACTQTAAFYDVPREVPLLRFLDTRGLGEAHYDPAQDIAWCEDQSHLVLAVMQVADPPSTPCCKFYDGCANDTPSGRSTAFTRPGQGIQIHIPTQADRRMKGIAVYR
jgi:50S ribosome-binding GTPase